MNALLDNMLGASAIATTVVLSPILRPWYSHWGATPDEIARPLPGDDLIRQPKNLLTHAVTISASPAEVWAWIAQLGQGRGGLYSYDGLENLVGCDIHSADHILPEHQTLQVGDKIRFGPDGYPLNTVYDLKVAQYLLTHDCVNMATGEAVGAHSRLPQNYAITTWLFHLEQAVPGLTRLIVRSRLDYTPTFSNIFTWRVLTEPISFVMERKMLLGIKARAEREKP